MQLDISVPTPRVKNTCAIVVTFNPDVQFPERLNQILSQFGNAILIDNGSVLPSRQMLIDSTAIPHLLVQWNETNLGIASALNQGLALAQGAGFEWAVTFDQDTLIHPRLLSTLLDVAALHTPKASLVGANYHDIHRDINAGHCTKAGKAYMRRKTVITSGTLLPLRFAVGIGGFREDYFIDSVDHEFCLRAAANGCKVFMTCMPLMEHRIGFPSKGRSGFFHRFSSHHPPLRKYFIARNAVTTIILYMGREPVWSIRQLFRLFAEFVSIISFEEQRCRKAAAFARGLWHGLIGKGGRYEDE